MKQATKKQIIAAIEYLDEERKLFRNLKDNKELVEMAVDHGFELRNINWDMDNWFYSASRTKLEGVDFHKCYSSDEKPEGYTIWF